MIRSASMRVGLLLVVALAAGGAGVAAQAPSGRAGQPAAPPPRPAPIPRPALAEAQQMLAASQAAAAKSNLALSCAVVDVRGDLVAAARMDGAAFLTADVARGKAVGSALLGQPSANLAQMAPILQSLSSVARIEMLPIQGALPIVRANQTVGAIGCSGGTSQQDEDAARAGLRASK